MPRKAKTKEGYRHDLVGTWYQCASSHLTDSPIFLGNFAYCDQPDCNLVVKLVHSSHDDKESVEMRRQVWNSMQSPSIGKVCKDAKEEASDEP